MWPTTDHPSTRFDLKADYSQYRRSKTVHTVQRTVTTVVETPEGVCGVVENNLGLYLFTYLSVGS